MLRLIRTRLADAESATPSRLPGHRYSLATMQFCLLGVVHAHTSYRSALLLCAHLGLGTPCPETQRAWLLRLGLYLLQQLPQRRTDWVWIIDHTLQWGTARCLVVLGVTAAQLREHGYCLDQAAVCVLTLEVVDHSDGEVVYQQLTALAARVGVPYQIVSDHGSDLTKGIRLFQHDHPRVLDTYDVAHKMACLLKGLLAGDDRWLAFVRQCAATGAKVRQTAGSFLLPPTLRAKARYMNLESLLNWAERMQGLAAGDVGERLAEPLDLAAAEARCWWAETFGWLADFAPDLQSWGQMWQLVCQAKEQVRSEGVRVESGLSYRAALPAPKGDDVRVRQLAAHIEEFLVAEGEQVAIGQAVLGSSEVIESVFGSYKHYVERSVWAEIGSNVLLLPVLLVTLSPQLLRRALTAVRGADVEQWCSAHLGLSRQQRFGAVFGSQLAQPAAPPVLASAERAPPSDGPEASRPPPQEDGQGMNQPPPTGKVAA